MPQPFGQMSIAQLSVLIQSGAVDPVAVAEAVLTGIGDYPDQAIFIALTPERALVEAADASRRIRQGRSLGWLDGIPVAWKDLFDLKDMTTTAGSTVLASASPAAADAPVVARLKAAGMVAVGRTNMSEFAFSGIGINPHYGTPANPAATGPARVPGGSSSGAAAAVAAGLVPVAIGTDTGGSIRIPSAFTGLVGYKATRGRYPVDGVFPLSRNLDSLGPLCRSVQDAVWIDSGMGGADAATVARGDVSGLELAIPEETVFDGAEPGVVAAFEAAVVRLERAGAQVSRISLPAFPAILSLIARHGPLVTADAYALHRERLSGPDVASMDARVAKRIQTGAGISMPDYVALTEARARLTAETAARIGNRLVIFPSVAHVAPLVQPLIDDEDLFFATNGKTLRNTMLGNFLDWCGLSIPCGTGEAGMPVGFLLSAPAGADARLLSAGLAVEAMIRG